MKKENIRMVEIACLTLTLSMIAHSIIGGTQEEPSVFPIRTVQSEEFVRLSTQIPSTQVPVLSIPVIEVSHIKETPPIGSSLGSIEDVETQAVGFDIARQPTGELIQFTIAAISASTSYHYKNSLRLYDQSLAFRAYLTQELESAGYTELLQDQHVQTALNHISDTYYVPDLFDLDGNPEAIQCVRWQELLASTRGILAGAPIMASSYPGDALDAAAYLLNMPDGVSEYKMGGTVVRFPKDRADVTSLLPGDTVFVRYGDIVGHEVVVLANGVSPEGEPMVLVTDSNRVRNQDGVLITDGTPRLRWMTQDIFVEQYETTISRAVALRLR